jgi:hypothetical protein
MSLPMRNVISRAVFFAVMLTGLAGCASVEELHRRDEANCARAGHEPSTPDFDNCVQWQQIRRRSFLTSPFL